MTVVLVGSLWAVADERSRRLPGMLAHTAGNLQTTAILYAALRF